MMPILKELPIKNPRARLSDRFPVKFKIFWKKNVSPLMGNSYYHTIIPSTNSHAAWVLGAQPDEAAIKKLHAEHGGGKKKVHIVNMLSDKERVITEKSSFLNQTKNWIIGDISIMPWLDHGTINTTNGRNQTTKSMESFQDNLHKEFSDKNNIFYCHCMAGRSRSFVETMAFIYFYPNKEELFDFKEWPKDIKDAIPDNLKARLQDNPSFYDIAEYVRIRRPKTKKLAKMDGDQAGLLGLMTLSKLAGDLGTIKEVNINRLFPDARNIGLVLKAPLDSALRDPEDRKAQEDNFIKVYQSYKERGVDLLLEMVVPVGVNEIVSPEDTFAKNFRNLKPSEQARFAILLKGIKSKGLDTGKILPESYIYLAKIAVEEKDKLTAGDQLELLRTFGDSVGLTYKEVALKILQGGPIDRYNAGIQLAELVNLNSDSHNEVPHIIKQTLKKNKLSSFDQTNFIQRLSELRNSRVGEYVDFVTNNYKKGKGLFTVEQKETIDKAVKKVEEIDYSYQDIKYNLGVEIGSSNIDQSPEQLDDQTPELVDHGSPVSDKKLEVPRPAVEDKVDPDSKKGSGVSLEA